MNNLLKRIATSLILFVLLITCLFYNDYLLLLLIITISSISFLEFRNLIKKIWKRNINKIQLYNSLSIFYLILFSYSAFSIGKSSWILALYIISISIMSDIGGYIVGKYFGGMKLTKISPNKTISGTIGSFVFSLFPLVYVFYKYEYENIFSLIILTLSLSFISQSGDLFISYFKRLAKVKDTGKILPGHGGLLDRIDGIIFVIPSAFIILLILGEAIYS